MSWRHKAALVAMRTPEWGDNIWIQQTPFNNVLVCRSEAGRYGGQFPVRLIANGRVVAMDEGGERYEWSMASDGRLALSLPRLDESGEKYFLIFVDGVETYRVEMDCLHRLQWLDSGELAWSASRDFRKYPEERGMQYFINGGKTDQLQLDSCWREDMGGVQMLVMDFRTNRGYSIHDNGTVEELGPARKLHGTYEETEWRVMKKQIGEPELCEGYGGVFVRYRDVQGPRFIRICGNSDSGPVHTFNRDKSKIAYRGMKYAFLERLKLLVVSPVAYPLFFIHVASHDPRASYWKKTERFCVVEHPKQWKKFYLAVQGLFYAEDNALVAEVQTKNGMRVVIDQDEGPEFDEVACACFSPAEKAITYFARKGNDYFRVQASRVL